MASVGDEHTLRSIFKFRGGFDRPQNKFQPPDCPQLRAQSSRLAACLATELAETSTQMLRLLHKTQPAARSGVCLIEFENEPVVVGRQLVVATPRRAIGCPQQLGDVLPREPVHAYERLTNGLLSGWRSDCGLPFGAYRRKGRSLSVLCGCHRCASGCSGWCRGDGLRRSCGACRLSRLTRCGSDAAIARRWIAGLASSRCWRCRSRTARVGGRLWDSSRRVGRRGRRLRAGVVRGSIRVVHPAALGTLVRRFPRPIRLRGL